jgi:hypothetical protein
VDAIAWTAADREQLAARGMDPREAAGQLETLASPPVYAAIERPCTPGDGIEPLDERALEQAHAAHARAREAGRVTAFVPASGAATRMFRDLAAATSLPGALEPAAVDALARAGRAEAEALAEFVAGLPRLALADALFASVRARGGDPESLREGGPWRPLLEALLSPEGLDASRRPKALLPFHREGAAVRTALEEHLVEGVALAADAGGRCRLHFTVSPEHRAGFEALLASARPAYESRASVRYEIRLSEQHPSTDTVAAVPGGGPFRDERGGLLFRPAGHGALLRNLTEGGADLVFVKNVDNVAVDRLKGEASRWSRALVGLAAELSSRAHALHARLADAADAAAPAEARQFLSQAFGRTVDGPREALAAALDRPVRACGMVRNTGEPGGGPFWVRGEGGAVSAQIVESAQVAPDEAAQAVFRTATHFNPVVLACALRDAAGRPHELERFVDPRTAIVTRKTHGGRELLALERPGLWNGAMAGWNTRFVEVPLAVFNPVKTVLDLLRPEHQP